MKAWIAAAAFALFAAPASAEEFRGAAEPADGRAVSVSYADLDVSETDNARVLLSRLQYAATRACEVNAVTRPGPSLRRAIEECRAAALNEAVQEANSQEVSRLHDEQRR